ncbi:MAG TPA: hypothetical protein VKA98_02565 [Nitrososphaeraceae archaeon]|nr:hypothetical protein [Nitrososphaeraceae archaeon]
MMIYINSAGDDEDSSDECKVVMTAVKLVEYMMVRRCSRMISTSNEGKAVPT